jgi:hypothetical protein
MWMLSSDRERFLRRQLGVISHQPGFRSALAQFQWEWHSGSISTRAQVA